ncbi:MAG: DUF4838 domain-containing protein, partial [Armatimonadetes bacterium]|nr:DUF4838 domain-containing protein [Armatimonadota bacterium]
LATHLERITGAKFAVGPDPGATAGRVLIGARAIGKGLLSPGEVQALGDDGFIVRVAGNALLLVGGGPRGTLYAVYSFLEDDLGCRWLTWYGDESVPRRPELQVGALNRTERPAFAVRDLCVQGGVAGQIRDAHLRFLVRNRDQGPDLLRRYGADLAAYGGASHRYGLPPGVWMVHTLYAWVPPDKYFADHPDFFSLHKGKRQKRQLCFTNPELRATLTANVLAGIAATDPAGNYSISAQDDGGPFCECPACQALVDREGTPGAPLFDYVAELAATVKEKYPRAFLTTLAYRHNQSEKPPRTIKLPDNVIVIFAPINANIAQPLEHPSNAETLANLQAWPQHTRHLWVWYYPNPYGQPLPLGSLERLWADFRLFRKVGVEGFFVEHDTAAVYRSVGLVNLQTWLLTKLMWNPDRDLNELVTDFTDRYYGAAAPLIRQYSDRLEAATRALQQDMSWRGRDLQFVHLTPEFQMQSQALFDRAEATVKDDVPLLARVRQARMGVDLAGVVTWPRLRSTPGLPLKREAMLDRYCQTYTATMRANIDPQFSGADLLKWHKLMTPLKPLPPPLDQAPPEHVWQITPEVAQLYKKGYLVEDKDAAAGFAAELKTDGRVPANLGYWEAIAHKLHHVYPGKEKEPLQPGQYHLYHLARSPLSEYCVVWADWSWMIVFELDGANEFLDPEHPKRDWDLYLSANFDGPAYGGQADVPNRVRVDRVVIVPAP